MYEKDAVRRQLREYYKVTNVVIDGFSIEDGEIVIEDDEDDFFNIEKNKEVNTDATLDNMQIIDHITYMEQLLNDIEAVTTDREYDVCLLISAGYTLQRVGNIMGVTRERIRQIENKAVDKLVAAHKDK